MAIACVVNIIGDLLFVAVLDMNAAGAALATVMAQAVSVILSLVILKKQDLPFTVRYFRGDLLAGIFSSDAAVVEQAALYLKGFAPEAVATAILFSLIGYFNGHGQTLFVMIQGLGQTFVVRLPMSYIMSSRPNASLTGIGLAAPCASAFGILLNVIYFGIYSKRMKKERMVG